VGFDCSFTFKGITLKLKWLLHSGNLDFPLIYFISLHFSFFRLTPGLLCAPIVVVCAGGDFDEATKKLNRIGFNLFRARHQNIAGTEVDGCMACRGIRTGLYGYKPTRTRAGGECQKGFLLCREAKFKLLHTCWCSEMSSGSGFGSGSGSTTTGSLWEAERSDAEIYNFLRTHNYVVKCLRYTR